MSKEEQIREAFEWNEICQQGCHEPFAHSHNFVIGREIKKVCSGCSIEMSADAQMFGNIAGQNIAFLTTVYQCPRCNKSEKHHLYNGQSRDPSTVRTLISQDKL